MPFQFPLRYFMTRLCQFISIEEEKVPVISKYPALANKIFTYVKNLTLFKEINPLPRCLIPLNFEFAGLLLCADRSALGLGANIYVLSKQHNVPLFHDGSIHFVPNLVSNIVKTASRLSNYNTFVNEFLSHMLSFDNAVEIATVLQPHFHSKKFPIFLATDNFCTTYLYSRKILTTHILKATKEKCLLYQKVLLDIFPRLQ